MPAKARKRKTGRAKRGKPKPSRQAPARKQAAKKAAAGHDGAARQPRFAVQQHDPASMRYDFRLEYGGVLKCWAVPGGPPAGPGGKRLATATRDRPLGYAGFEGLIDHRRYRAGPVIVWDSGTYQNETAGPSGKSAGLGEAIERGHVRIRLHGKRLRGGYELTRMAAGTGSGRGRKRWLLVKMAGECAGLASRPA